MGLYKRGKVWWMRFTYKGKVLKMSTGTKDRKLAQKIFSKATTQAVEDKWFDLDIGSKTTFDELMEKYLTEHSIKKAKGTGVKRDRSSSKHLLKFFGGFKLNEVTPKFICDYKALRYRMGAMPATINRELALMKHAFTLATREWELARDNPVKRVSMEKENNARDKWLTANEEKKLLKLSPKWLQELIVFAVNTGMRMEEILSLEWKYVDLERAILIVMKSKNKEKRSIPINQTVLRLLRTKTRIRYMASDFVFTSSKGTKLDQGNVRRVFIPAREEAKLGDLRFHDLRHTFATRLVQSGVDLYKVQKLLGHKTPQMTQRYAHHYPESLRDGVELLDGSNKQLVQFWNN